MRLYFFCFMILTGPFLFASYLTKQDIDSYYKQGFCIVRQAISQEELELIDEKTKALSARLINSLKSAHYTSKAGNQKTYIDGSQVVFKKPFAKTPSIKRVVGCESIEPSLKQILRSKKMMETFFALLNADAIEQLVSQYHPRYPGDGIYSKKHKDIMYHKDFDPNWTDVGKNGSYAVCIIAIDPMSPENGGFLIDMKSFSKEKSAKLMEVKLDPGDMLFIHPEIVYWSRRNKSEISCRTILAGYCIYGANHRNYPGDCTNDVITNRSFSVRPAPWKKLGDTHF